MDAVYFSSSPLLAEFFAECERRRQAFEAARLAFQSEFPGFRTVESRVRGFRQVAGLINDTEGVIYTRENPRPSPGALWRQVGRIWYPARRSKAGKELDARMEAIVYREPALPGMPDRAYAETRVCWPGIEPIESPFTRGYWATWTCPFDVVEAHQGFDPAIWQRSKWSAYWLAKETQDAE